MITVGISKLKNRLSHYIREVREGETVLVTDRGEVVAELRSHSEEPLSGTPVFAGTRVPVQTLIDYWR
jgi:prevent-host-death family protein